MPKVENFCGGVQVTIARTKFMQITNVGGRVGGDVGDHDETKLTERHKDILNLIKKMLVCQPTKCRRFCR